MRCYNEKKWHTNLRPTAKVNMVRSERMIALKKDDIIKLSLFIITEYYKNNLIPFFEYISDDIIWIGPAERQQIRGRTNLIHTFSMEKHALTFTMGDIKVLYASPHSHVKEVFLHYDIYTHYPTGNTVMHNQWLHYTWREKKTAGPAGLEYRPEIICLHISNAHAYDVRDTIYPVHYENIPSAMPAFTEPKHYVTVKSVDGCVHRIAASHILYITPIKHSAKLQIHTENESIIIPGTLSAFEKKYPGLFLRVHYGYLLNLAHVTNIRRFTVTLSDGTELPIPEKKYTWVKKLLLHEDVET